MIDIVTDKERNLKNLKQIGTPREENKIYIENFAYAKIKEKSYKEKRVFPVYPKPWRECEKLVYFHAFGIAL